MLRTIGNMVLVEPDRPAEKHGPVFIPETARAAPDTGVVVAAGPEAGVAAGQRVLYPCAVGIESSIDGKDVLGLNALDIMAVIE